MRNDPLVVGTVRLVDELLKVDTPAGPAWHRYTGDGYGEHDDGSPFDGTGRGRAWPLLTGERGHYELAAGRDPLPYLEAMSEMVGRCGLIPEQVWDAAPPPLSPQLLGKPSGSAMPLVWAHAEFVKLVASRTLGRPFDRPEALWLRYGGRRPTPSDAIWSPRMPTGRIRAGQTVCLCLPAAARVHYGMDNWRRTADIDTEDSGLTLHVAQLPSDGVVPGSRIDFTLYWRDTDTWEGRDYSILVE